jgi:hypothetical protein
MAEAWLRSHPRRSGLLAVAAAAGVVVAGINVFHTFGPIHLHDDGPLGSLSGAGFAFASSTTGPWTAGYELCLDHGIDPAIIQSVSPASLVGSGLTFLGAFVREIPAGPSGAPTSGSIGTVEGYPPTISGAHHAVAGYPVTHQCSTNGSHQPFPYTELDVGVARAAHASGGGWTGFTVAYIVDSTPYVVTWDTGLYACGPGASVSALCAPPP